jgi:hypothetical protein
MNSLRTCSAVFCVAVLSVRLWEGVNGFGGGVGVETMAGGVLDCWMPGAGDAGVFMAAVRSTTLPSESLMTMAALFLGGRVKAVEDAMAGAAG